MAGRETLTAVLASQIMSNVPAALLGHPGGAMGGSDFINVLFSEFLVYDPENPSSPPYP